MVVLFSHFAFSIMVDLLSLLDYSDGVRMMCVWILLGCQRTVRYLGAIEMRAKKHNEIVCVRVCVCMLTGIRAELNLAE